MKTNFEGYKKQYIKSKEDLRINKLSLVAWMMAMLVAVMFWFGLVHAFEDGYVSRGIAKLHRTTVSHLAKR